MEINLIIWIKYLFQHFNLLKVKYTPVVIGGLNIEGVKMTGVTEEFNSWGLLIGELLYPRLVGDLNSLLPREWIFASQLF